MQIPLFTIETHPNRHQLTTHLGFLLPAFSVQPWSGGQRCDLFLSPLTVVLQVIALIIYPVKFNELIFEGNYYYTWAYGFGWGATILCIGCAILFCCLPRYEDELSGLAKTKYIYSSA